MAPSDTIEKFPVVMLYDHFSSVGAAMATFSHLTHELEMEFEPELRVWRMDEAASPELINQANADIAAAEVIIVTVRTRHPWPEAFHHWRDGTDGDGTGIVSPQAIVTVIEAEEDGTPGAIGPANSVLSLPATQIHPEVFVYESKAILEKWLSFGPQDFSGSVEDCLADIHSD